MAKASSSGGFRLKLNFRYLLLTIIPCLINNSPVNLFSVPWPLTPLPM